MRVHVTIPTGLPTESRVPELKAAFELVESKRHWKAPIDTVVVLDCAHDATPSLKDIAEAVVFYTGTVAEITFLGTVEGDDTKCRFRITAPGYWAGQAA